MYLAMVCRTSKSPPPFRGPRISKSSSKPEVYNLPGAVHSEPLAQLHGRLREATHRTMARVRGTRRGEVSSLPLASGAFGLCGLVHQLFFFDFMSFLWFCPSVIFALIKSMDLGFRERPSQMTNGQLFPCGMYHLFSGFPQCHPM